jgi:hypothetical protein
VGQGMIMCTFLFAALSRCVSSCKETRHAVLDRNNNVLSLSLIRALFMNGTFLSFHLQYSAVSVFCN